jgi:hypothetical protein
MNARSRRRASVPRIAASPRATSRGFFISRGAAEIE